MQSNAKLRTLTSIEISDTALHYIKTATVFPDSHFVLELEPFSQLLHIPAMKYQDNTSCVAL